MYPQFRANPNARVPLYRFPGNPSLAGQNVHGGQVFGGGQQAGLASSSQFNTGYTGAGQFGGQPGNGWQQGGGGGGWVYFGGQFGGEGQAGIASSSATSGNGHSTAFTGFNSPPPGYVGGQFGAFAPPPPSTGHGEQPLQTFYADGTTTTEYLSNNWPMDWPISDITMKVVDMSQANVPNFDGGYNCVNVMLCNQAGCHLHLYGSKGRTVVLGNIQLGRYYTFNSLVVRPPKFPGVLPYSLLFTLGSGFKLHMPEAPLPIAPPHPAVFDDFDVFFNGLAGEGAQQQQHQNNPAATHGPNMLPGAAQGPNLLQPNVEQPVANIGTNNQQQPAPAAVNNNNNRATGNSGPRAASRAASRRGGDNSGGTAGARDATRRRQHNSPSPVRRSQRRRVQNVRDMVEFGPPVTPPFNVGDGIALNAGDFSLPILEVTQQMIDDKDICTVCQHGYELGNMDCTILPCDHVYHIECIRGWLSRCARCPICNFS